MFLIFDTETTGLPRNWKAPLSDSDNWPRMVQLAWQIHDELGNLVEVQNFIVKPDGYTIPFNAEKVHGISTERAEKCGVSLKMVLEKFSDALERAEFVVGHNVEFDLNIVGAEFLRCPVPHTMNKKKVVDTKDTSTDFCKLPGGKGGKFKWPTLTELYDKLFSETFNEAHNASADVEATTRCFLEMLRIGVIHEKHLKKEKDFLTGFNNNNVKPIQLIGLNIEPYSELPNEEVAEPKSEQVLDSGKEAEIPEMPWEENEIGFAFSHLHNHTQYSVLQSTSRMKQMMAKASEDKMPAVALTDHCNMFAAFNFVKLAKSNGIKAILGCEMNVCEDMTNKSNKDNGYMVVFLAKNKAGYHNLAKLSSASFIEGFYYVPRIDKKVLIELKKDLIVLSGGILGEIPSLILNVGEEQAEEALLWWKQEFGEDFYLELINHGLEEEKRVNEVLLRFSEKHNVKVVAANNNYYLKKEDANAHDILMCVKEGEYQSTPIGRGRGFRPGFPNNEFYFKSQDEMKQLFRDIPQAIENVVDVVDKIEEYSLEQEILLPEYTLPEGYATQDEYLKFLTYEGANKRYETPLSDEVKERLDFELEVIKNMRFPGYFLIVQDFTTEARRLGVSVGPGRGSAAGSAVAFATGITNIDPIKYKLLFERFLNPERVSMPDIDIDFDDDNRSKVIDYVVNKYGKTQVAQIITYGTMAAKSAIRDVGRVLEFPLPETDKLAKTVPEGITLNNLFATNDKDLGKKINNSDELAKAKQFKKIASDAGKPSEIIQQARILEGSVRNIGTHACGIIITPDDLKNYIPVTTAKDSELLVTQYDNKVVEDAGLLKMDFLGLKTLTIIKDAIDIIRNSHGKDINPDDIPLDDEVTFGMYQRGETNGTFQFESGGMQKHLKELKPNNIEDLIAMNALYRPGPMQYIELFIARKHGREKVEYPHLLLEGILKDTYGIMVYQEQIMQTAQILAGYSLGQADLLRRAMGKKKMDVMEKQKEVFIKGAKEHHDIDEEKSTEVFDIMMKFAEYGFNRSHSAAYSVVAFQTGYLKANYPAEYMAAVLANNMNDLKKVSFFMEECKRMNLEVLGPCVNESGYRFVVNKKGQIRFGLGAIKGVGEGPVQAILEARKEGEFTSVFEMCRRVDLKSVNKKAMESMAYAGAFDSIADGKRSWLFFPEEKGGFFLEKVIKFGNAFQKNLNSPQQSLFGDGEEIEVPEPPIPECEDWGTLKKLSHEKQVVGMFISGHPLDDFKLELESFCNLSLDRLHDLGSIKGHELKVAGIVTEASHRISKTGKPYGSLTLEDYRGSFQFMLFSDDYLRFKQYMEDNWFLFIQGKVQLRKYGEPVPEFKISRMEILSELREKFTESLNISVPLNKVNKDFTESLHNILISSKGKCKVKMVVEDYVENNKIQVELPSKSIFINPSNELLNKLSKIDGLNYKLS